MSSSSRLKLKVSLGWNSDYVFDADDALQFMELLKRAEAYEVKYHNDTKETTQHIYPMDLSKKVQLNVMDETVYHGAKMAGKPE